MNIIYLCGFDLESGVAAAKRVFFVAKALEMRGHNISFLDMRSTKRTVSNWRGFSIASIQRKNSILGQIQTKVSYRDIIESIGHRDVVIAYNYPAIPLLNIRRYCKRHGIRIIGDVADWPLPDGSVFHKLVMNIDINTRMRKVLPSLDGLIVISEYLANYYSKMKHLIIPPMVDVDATIKEVGFSDYNKESLVLTTINTAGPEKEALLELLHMISKVIGKVKREVILNVIGMTELQYEQRYHDSVPENIKKNVHFLGRLPYHDTIRIISISAYFMFIRKHNQVNDAGFPTKFSEALSCGTPILTTRTSDLDRYLEQGINGAFIDSENDLLLAIDKDNDEINRLKKNCANYREFDYRKYATLLDDFISAICNAEESK